MPAPQHEQQAREKHPAVRCAVITVSDTRTEESDTSGQTIKSLLAAANQPVVKYAILKDEPTQIVSLLSDLVNDGNFDAVLINGGTGISRRDSTVEAVAALFEKTLVGFGELFRMLSYQEIGPAAMLSRAVAGTYRGLVVFCMPGSTNAVRLAMDRLIVPELSHLVWELRK
jgi:molybdenum cofactor biosynthesis protein B